MITETSIGNKLIGFFRGLIILHLTHGYCKIYIPAVYPIEWKDNPELIPPAELAASLFAGANSGSGAFTYPNIGSIVWCFFANNDQNYPIYFASSLGGENAFGQYELIKLSSENVSDRHMITSGKTHLQWYENGKLSIQVEDPDRRDAIVDYNNAYIGLISDDIVSARPICDKVAVEELSNIHCKIVLDNDIYTYGSISALTHHFDLSVDNEISMTLTNDNDFIIDNTGHVKLEELSTYTFEDKNNKVKSINNNRFLMAIPGQTIIDNKTYENNEIIGLLTTDISAENNISSSTDGNYTVNVDNNTHITSIATPFNVDKECKNSFRIAIPGKSIIDNHLTSFIATEQIPIDAITSDIEIATSTDGTITHNIHVIKNQETADENTIYTDTAVDETKTIDAGHRCHMSYLHNDKNSSIAIKNDLTSDELVNDVMNAKKTFEMTSVGTIPSPIDISFKDNFNSSDATILRNVDNKLLKIVAQDLIDATNSTHDIMLDDRKTSNVSHITMNTNDGSLTISIVGLNGSSKVVMKSDGTMSIDTSDKLTVTTTNTVSVNTKKIEMTGSEQIDIISPKINIGKDADEITIGNAGKTTTNVQGSAGDCLIDKTSLNNHTHPFPYNAGPSPAVGMTNVPVP